MNYRTSILSRRNLRAYFAALITYVMLAGQLAPFALAAARTSPPARSAAPASAPLPDRIDIDGHGPRDFTIVQAIGRQEHDPRPLGELLRGARSADQPLQLGSFLGGHPEWWRLRPRHRALLSPAGDAILALPTVFSQGVLVGHVPFN